MSPDTLRTLGHHVYCSSTHVQCTRSHQISEAKQRLSLDRVPGRMAPMHKMPRGLCGDIVDSRGAVQKHLLNCAYMPPHVHRHLHQLHPYWAGEVWITPKHRKWLFSHMGVQHDS